MTKYLLVLEYDDEMPIYSEIEVFADTRIQAMVIAHMFEIDFVDIHEQVELN